MKTRTPPRGAERPAREEPAGDAVAPGGVAAVERALTILDAFRADDPSLTLTELARRAGLHKSTTLRLAASLEAFGYLRRLEGGAYVVGPTPLRLAAHHQRQLRTADVVPPALRRLCDALGEGASFFVRDGDRALCLHRVDSARLVRDVIREGESAPLQVGAAGQVLLAFGGAAGEKHEAVRRRGYVSGVGERDLETGAVACPVLGPGDRLLGALAVSGPKYRMERLPPERLLPLLLGEARQISLAMGGAAERPSRGGEGPREPSRREPT
jgi:DNA-binding IclR family transcriptional regulator